MCSIYLAPYARGLGSESVRHEPIVDVLPVQHLPAALFYYTDTHFTSMYSRKVFHSLPVDLSIGNPTAEH